MAEGGHIRASDILKHLECPICMENFKVPRSLPKCLHNFCQTCLVTYLSNTAKDPNPEYHCPVCRMVIDLNVLQHSQEAISKWVNELPLNHICVSLLDEVPEVEGITVKDHGSGSPTDLAKREEMCAAHKGRPLEYICWDHDEILCDSCVVKSHRKCEKVEDLQTALKLSADSTSRHVLSNRLDEVRNDLNKTIDGSRRDVDDIVNAEKIIESQISDFKQKLKVLISLADDFEHDIMESSKAASSKLTEKESVNTGLGMHWLLSLDEAQRKSADTSVSAVQLLKARQSLLDIVAKCENFVDSITPTKKQLFSLVMYPSLDNVLKDGFGRFIESGVDVLNAESRVTATPTLKCVPQTPIAKCEYSVITPVPISFMFENTDGAKWSNNVITSNISNLSIECIDSVRITVPRTRVPLYTDAAYLHDGRVVLVDKSHQRLVLLDEKLRFQSYLYTGEQEPCTVAYIGRDAVIVSLVDNDDCDKFAVVTVRGNQMGVHHTVDIDHFNLVDIVALDDEYVLVCTSNSNGKYCFSEMSIHNGHINYKLLKVNGQSLNCVNGFAVDTSLRDGESLQRIYIYRGCDDSTDYRLVCTNMNGKQIFEYSNSHLLENLLLFDIDREGNVYIANANDIVVVSKNGEDIKTITTDNEDMYAISFNQKKDRFIITNNAWSERKLIEEFSVTYM